MTVIALWGRCEFSGGKCHNQKPSAKTSAPIATGLPRPRQRRTTNHYHVGKRLGIRTRFDQYHRPQSSLAANPNPPGQSFCEPPHLGSVLTVCNWRCILSGRCRMPGKTNIFCARVAQLVEHLICNQAVVGSSPTFGYPLFA